MLNSRYRTQSNIRDTLRYVQGQAGPNDPWVTGVTPTVGSPNGGVIVTIYGENLFSKKITLGGQQTESENEGEDYRIWFSKTDK